MTSGPQNTSGPFLPINQTFSEDQEQYLIQATNRDRDIARFINIREIAVYDGVQYPTGQQWENPSNVQQKKNSFRKVFYVSDANLIFNHGITGITLCTAIYGTGFDGTTNFYPLPYVDVTSATNQIMIQVTATQVIITKGAGAPPAISNGVIVLEFLLN
jgi:hypothetical protein